MMHREQDRNDHIRMELRRLLNSVVLVPAMVIRRARSSTVRTIGDNPGPDRLLSTWSTIERTRFGRPGRIPHTRHNTSAAEHRRPPPAATTPARTTQAHAAHSRRDANEPHHDHHKPRQPPPNSPNKTTPAPSTDKEPTKTDTITTPATGTAPNRLFEG